ncbi:ArfGap-domain-containing protein [Poronia punctata]|nr:ArfGap-domain-containing protein [Poronia punctata]
MAGLISKRQQARNERALQDLVHNVEGNNLCADCGARNPSWASWNLGIFLCMRCATIHRKLGTHISKVKSLSMDSWTNEQVENMKRTGNSSSNKTYNPQNKRPPVPIDADEADSAMERFIRSKYMQSQNQSQTNGARKQNTGSSDEGTPPPLPPKTGGRFFKSATLPFRSKKETKNTRGPSPQFDEHLRNKPSKVFGASVHHDSLEDTAQKLTQLRDMGFADDQRNAMILKGVNGNLEKTVEALVRLGEGGGGLSPGLTTTRDPLSRSVTPKPPARANTNGLSTVNLSKPSPPLPVQSPSSPSNDPWEISPAQPQSSQSTGTLQNTNPFYNHNNNNNNNNNNPFGMPTRRTDSDLIQSLQSLSVTPQAPLFPHHTGGTPGAQPISQYQHSMTPPVPQYQNFASAAFNGNQTYSQQPQIQQQGYNPFLQTPAAPQHPLSINTSQYQQQGPMATNPFTRSPTRINSAMLNQIPEQSQQNVYHSPQTPYSPNPFLSMNQAAQPSSSGQQQWYEIQQPAYAVQQHYPTQQSNKDAIMALYGSPQPTPPQVHSPGQVSSNPFETSQATLSQPQQQQQQQQQHQPQIQPQMPLQRSASVLGKNPFASTAASTNGQTTSNARSRESMMLGNEMAWNNGRHSPDAFASLSARSGF